MVPDFTGRWGTGSNFRLCQYQPGTGGYKYILSGYLAVAKQMWTAKQMDDREGRMDRCQVVL